MSRIDKYEPKGGGCRAPINFDTVDADMGVPFGVGLNSSGRVVKGAGNTGVKGVLVLTTPKKAGDIVDVMQDGEVVEFGKATGETAGAAGSNYFADGTSGAVVVGTGSLTATAPVAAGSKMLGFTVEATRLVVRVARS